MTSSYVGFRADDTGLVYFGSRWKTPRVRRAQLTPQGLELVPDAGLSALSWDDYLPASAAFLRRGNESSWSISPRAARETATEINVGEDPTARNLRSGLSVRLCDPFWDQIFPGLRDGSVVLQALSHYLSETPAARAGLADPARCANLIKALRAGRLHRAAKAEDRLYIGQRGDLHRVLDKTVAARARLFAGRAVAGEPFPSEQQLRDLVLAGMPTRIDKTHAATQLSGFIADWTARPRWPFGLLNAESTT